MERLSVTTSESILRLARRAGVLLFIDTDGVLKVYPKTNSAVPRLREMLAGQHPEMKMHIIRTMSEETCLSN